MKAGMNPGVAKGVAANVSGLAAAGVGGAAGGAAGAGVALSVDANSRQLHFDEKQRIAVKANGDKKAEERLTKAACYGLNRSYPAYAAKPGISVNVGNIVGGADAKVTNDFLKGGGMQGNAYVPPVPAMPLVNVGGGVNHSYGGKTAVEVGVSTQPGVSVAPISYGFGGEKSGAGK